MDGIVERIGQINCEGARMTTTGLFFVYLVEHYCGVAIITYRINAMRHNWQMGLWYSEPHGASPVKLLGLAAILHSAIGSWMQLGWESALGIVALVFVFNYPVSSILGWRAQVLCPIAAVACAGAAIYAASI